VTGVTPGSPQLIGYFAMPHRFDWPGEDYTDFGIGGWHFKTKFDGPYRAAPIMSDLMQAGGQWNPAADSGNLVWSTVINGQSVATASHIHNDNATGVPAGGNFLFEDGHVKWHRFDSSNPPATIDLGCTSVAGGGGWKCFLKIPNIQTNL
jgi:hypothetical protein